MLCALGACVVEVVTTFGMKGNFCKRNRHEAHSRANSSGGRALNSSCDSPLWSHEASCQCITFTPYSSRVFIRIHLCTQYVHVPKYMFIYPREDDGGVFDPH